MSSKSVYLISSSFEEGVVGYKIGISKHPKKRIKELKTANWGKIELVHEFKSNYSSKLETTLHRLYKIYNQNGEWFYLPNSIINNFISTCEKLEMGFSLLKDNPFF